MPIYEYRCSKCGHELEALQKLSEAQLTDCPVCHETTLVKQMSAAGFQLKGSGWYATDFRGGNAGKPAPSGEAAKSDAKADAKADAKTDSKPAGDSPAEKKSDTKAASSPAAATKASPVTDAG
jgi:putative FmdB family regulatory protein